MVYAKYTGKDHLDCTSLGWITECLNEISSHRSKLFAHDSAVPALILFLKTIIIAIITNKFAGNRKINVYFLFQMTLKL